MMLHKMSLTHLKRTGFVSIKRDWKKWMHRKDLIDYVITKSVGFISGFISQVENLKRPTFAALFIKRFDMVDEVLNDVGYNDDDLVEFDGLST